MKSNGFELNYIISFNKFEYHDLKLLSQFLIDESTFMIVLQCKIPPIINENIIFCTMQTSGSTGKNKVIKIPYECIKQNAESLK